MVIVPHVPEFSPVTCNSVLSHVEYVDTITYYLTPFINKENILVLDGISDPGNMGTILRSAAWFGIKNIICSPTCVDIYNPKTVRSAMGAHFYSSFKIKR